MSQRLELASGEVVADRVEWARSAWSRLRGLVGRDLEPGVALILTPAYQVHTFLMKSPIDVALCDREWRVLWIRRHMPPNRISAWRTRGRYAIELRAGAIPAEVSAGTQLRLVDAE